MHPIAPCSVVYCIMQKQTGRISRLFLRPSSWGHSFCGALRVTPARMRGRVPLCARRVTGRFREIRITCVKRWGAKKNEAGVSWRKIKAEYIAGGISQRKLAEKYGVNRNLLMRIAQREKWTDKRSKAEAKALEKVEQKTAEAVADNAVVLERIKSKLLNKVETMIDNVPDTNAAEKRERIGNADYIYRLKDLAAVYSALEDKTVRASVDIEDLSPLVELLRDD